MTSRSRTSHPTTRRNTTSARAADAYRAVAQATAPAADPSRPGAPSEPLWLPAGWLAIVLTLTTAIPAPGAEWRARRPGRPSPIRTVQFQQVDYENDIAGPKLRVASRDGDGRSVMRGYRVAQDEGDALQEAFERPFGAPEETNAGVNEALEDALERPFGVRDADPNAGADDYDRSEGLFDDVPADPFEENLPEPEAPAADDRREDYPQSPSDRFESEPEDTYTPDASEYERAPRERFEPEAPAYERMPDRGFIDDVDPPFDGRSGGDDLASERAAAAKDCAESLAELKADRLDAIDLTIAISGVEGEDYPFSCSIDDGSVYAPRCWAEVTYMWKASALCHKPLFFEDTQLERYGHSAGPVLQPLISGAHFFSRLAVLPYNAGLTAPNECMYTLGYYRPGDCAPWMIEAVPFTWRAAAFQAAASVGVAGILP